jgi:peptidoglycan/LPS O-acetylase OafA/YrhL
MTAFLTNFGPGKLRLVLAILVVFSHLSFVEIGRPAVFVFFMLSGYWVLRMYQQKYVLSGPVWMFYLSRFMRIWLPFATAFILTFTVFAVFSNAKPSSMLAGLPLLGIASTKRDVLGTAWSLDIELQFYLLLPLLSICLAWVGRQPSKMAWLALSIITLVVIGWYFQIHYGLWSVFSYSPPFVIGALIWQLRIKSSGRSALLSLGLFFIIGIGVALTPNLRPLLLRDVISPFNEDWFGMAWITTLVPLVIWNVQQKSGAFDVHLGNFSYALYITHWPVIALVRPLLQPLSIFDRVTIIGIILTISLAFYVIIDRGWEHLRRKVIYVLSVG